MEEFLAENITPSGEEVKKSVIDGQLAYKNGKTEEFEKIDSNNCVGHLPI